MSQRALLTGALAVLAAVWAVAVWNRSGEAPAGQPPLIELSAANIGSFRDQFHLASGNIRVVTLLSPT
ncbi:MAG: hypothetical protein JNL98_29575 [Bryobacterales bacterium]|nr:hypothetical protein [Bryobacterales bacterium]